MPKKDRNTTAELTPVTSYFPPSLVERVDREATKESRKRAPMVRLLVEQALESRKLVSKQ
jgi:hypothetical protein